jgi:hypothetical protein
MSHPGQLEKVACGAFSDSSFVSGRKRRDFCGLHSAASSTTIVEHIGGEHLSADRL